MSKWLDSIVVRPEAERKAAMNEYAELQIFKLKFTLLLLAVVWWLHS